jgi:hypothetical protein
MPQRLFGAERFDLDGPPTGQLGNATQVQVLQLNYPSEAQGTFSALRWSNDPVAQTMISSAGATASAPQPFSLFE